MLRGKLRDKNGRVGPIQLLTVKGMNACSYYALAASWWRQYNTGGAEKHLKVVN